MICFMPIIVPHRSNIYHRVDVYFALFADLLVSNVYFTFYRIVGDNFTYTSVQDQKDS